MQEQDKERLTVYLPRSLLAEIRRLAELGRRPVSSQTALLLERGIETESEAQAA